MITSVHASLMLDKRAIAPIGAVIDWYPLTAAPFLPPPGFVICNGQTINDVESPYNGRQAPDLRGRFTRGIYYINDLHDDRMSGSDTIAQDGSHSHGGRTGISAHHYSC